MFGLRVLLPLRVQEHRKGHRTFNGRRRTNGVSRLPSTIDIYNYSNAYTKGKVYAVGIHIFGRTP